MLNRGLNKIKRSFVDLLFNINLIPVVYNSKNGGTIFMYHGVDRNESKRFNLRHVGKDNFEQQILWMKKHFEVVPVEEFFEKRFTTDKYKIALTFDDGFRNNFEYAYPILEKHQVPATIYVTGINNTEVDALWGDMVSLAQGMLNKPFVVSEREFSKENNGQFIERETGLTLSEVCKSSGFSFKRALDEALKHEFDRYQPELLDYWKLMSDEEIKMLSKSEVVKVGSHAWYHNNLDQIELEAARKELVDAKAYLENLVQYEIKELAYPDGAYNGQLLDVATDVGYKYQLATEIYNSLEDAEDHRILKRAGIYPAYSWMYQIHQSFQHKVF